MPRFHLLILPLVVTLALTEGPTALCQDAAKTGDTAAANQELEATSHLAPVVIDGETLFSVRGVSAYPAERRAQEIRDRILAVAANKEIDPKSLTLHDQPGITTIMAGGQRIMALFDEDAAIERMNRTRLAETQLTRIEDAIESYRASRLPRLLWLHAFYSLIATFALLVAAYLGRRIVVRLRTAVEERYRARLQGIQERAFHIVKAEQIWYALRGILNFSWAVCFLLMVYAYLSYVLALFPWTRTLGEGLFVIIIDPLKTMALELIRMVPDLVFLAILVLITRYVLKLIRLFFSGVTEGSITLSNFDREWAWPTYRLVRVLAIAFAAVVAYPYIPGSRSEAFKGVSLFIGIMFTLGSSSLIGNLIAGYSMTYRRTFRLGDRVKIGEHVGDVESTRLLVTHLRTPKNEEVVVPNSTILGTEVVNYSAMARDRGLILHTTVGIGYETPWRQVEAILLEAAARTQGLRHEPAPFVLQKALGDFCVTHEINAYCDTPHAMPELYAALHKNILDLFNEYGIQIMTPAYVSDPEQPKVVPKGRWYETPARPPEGTGGA